MEHERFLREIRSLPFGNQEIAQRMGIDDTRISHYRTGRKWPSRRTLNVFNREFRSDLDAIEDENRIREKKLYEQTADQLYVAEEEAPLEVYQLSRVSLIMHNIASIENNLSTIKKAIEALAKTIGNIGENK
jgi:hypothetical protein